jgi:hypothetical protein
MEPPPMEDDNESLEDPTQIVPSSLYSLDMFSQSSDSQEDNADEGDIEIGEHCEAGTNEFTAPQSTVILVDRKEIAKHGKKIISFKINIESVTYQIFIELHCKKFGQTRCSLKKI